MQDFIVGSWELYAVSSSFSGPKVPAEEFGASLNVTFDADGTWDAFKAGPGVPPEASAGTWSKVQGGYLICEPGEPDEMAYRYANLFWQSALVDSVILWAWFCRVTNTPVAPGADVQLGQTTVGSTPFVRVNLHRGFIPDTSQVHAWLFYRGEIQPLAEPENIVGATSQARLNTYADDPAARLGVAFATEFTYFDRCGEQADGSVELTYDDPALVVGSSYYYKVQRVVDPIMPQVPVAGQVGAAQAALTVDPPEALGEASRTLGPVTYFTPAILDSPANNSTNENPTDLTFEWTPSVGANQYRVEVYDNPGFSGQPVYQSQPLSWTGQTIMTHKVTGYSFGGSTTYWWIVGNRVNPAGGEPLPFSYLGGQGREGWIYSSPFTFSTVEGPPQPWAVKP